MPIATQNNPDYYTQMQAMSMNQNNMQKPLQNPLDLEKNKAFYP